VNGFRRPIGFFAPSREPAGAADSEEAVEGEEWDIKAQ
jgi:hypothetical protein